MEKIVACYCEGYSLCRTCDLLFSHSDTASLNSLGYCRIEGRLKDMIIRGGENIYPAEIEQFLLTHHKVQDAQVRLRTTRGKQSISKLQGYWLKPYLVS